MQRLVNRSLGNRSARSLALAALVAAAANGACGSSDSSTPASSGPAAAAAPATPPPTAADQMAIDEVAVYQAVKTTVVKEGALVAKTNAPVIANRPALVRVFVKAIARTRPAIEGELRVKRAGKEDLVLKDGGKRIALELDDSAMEQTLNFEIGAEDMTPDATFSVKVGTKLDSGDVVTFPADGTAAPFSAKTASQQLRVKFVPVTYEADTGTSITPDLADMASLKETLYKMYPVASVEITVREPLKWSTPVKADGPGWDTLLSGIMQLRRADKAASDVYYVGVFTPKETIDQFCDKGSCILGIAPQAGELSVGMRAALVLGYKNRGAGSTLAQELAHAMGRAHAPCGSPQAVDTDYPYPGGSIGVFGYDIVTKTLLDPSGRYRDFMSYCGPTWTSDYTFAGIYERMEVVTAQQKALTPAPGASTPPGGAGAGAAIQSVTRQSFIVAKDGSIQEGPALEVIPGDGSGEHVDVAYVGPTGKVFSSAKAHVRTISGTGSRIVIAPEAPAGATHARLAGMGLTALSARLPSLQH
jgi:hypothetical protein